MKNAVERVRHCNLCNTFTEAEICEICASLKRDKTLLCVVETPGDLLMMEQTQTYRGAFNFPVKIKYSENGIVKELKTFISHRNEFISLTKNKE